VVAGARWSLKFPTRITTTWSLTQGPAESGGGVCGSCERRRRAVAPAVTFRLIAVVPAHRGCGLGKMLLAALLDEARGLGVSDVFLEVRADNEPAMALYESFGFRPIDRRVGYYQPDGVDAIVMRAGLVTPQAGWALEHD
jgi:ribosomal protein S18 acetylase RimI-like enzyme